MLNAGGRAKTFFAGGLLIAALGACSDDTASGGMMLPTGAGGMLAPAAGAPAAGSSAAGSSAAGSTAAPTGTAGTASAGRSGAAGTGAAGSAAGASGAAGAAGSAGTGSGDVNAAGSGGAAAGAGGAGGAAGAAGAAAGSGGAAAGSGAPEMHEDLGKGDGRDVVLLGDSYMSNTLQIEGTGGGIVPSLLQISGQRYRNYAVQGTMLLMDDTFGPAIPTQWDDAVRADKDIKTVIMTGGGNDIIQNATLEQSCKDGGADCKTLLLNENKKFDELWGKMADAGVEDVIHVAYATDTGTVAQSIIDDPDVKAPPPICTSGKIRCHELNTNDLIMKQIAGDGIHPLQAANMRVAQAIVDLMAKEGIRR